MCNWVLLYDFFEVKEMKFSEKLVRLRKNNHYSQEQLADLLDVSRQAVSKWESGQTYPEMDKLLSMCKIFKCSLDDLTNDEISEDDILKKKRGNVSDIVYEMLEIISKTFTMVRNMNVKQICQCLFELGILGLVLLLFKIPVYYIIELGDSVFQNFGSAYSVLTSIWSFILNMIYITLFVVVFVFIYKTRYLDKYETIESIPDKEDKQAVENTTKESVKTNSKNTPPKKEHTYVIFNTLGSLTMICIRLLALFISIPFIISFIGLFFILIIIIVFLFKGVFYIGILLGIIFCIVLNFMILEILFYFVFSRKLNTLNLFILFIVGIIGIGISCGITFFEVTSTTYINEAPISSKEEQVKKFALTDDILTFDEWYFYHEIEFVEDETMIDSIEVKASYYPDYIEVTIEQRIDGRLRIIPIEKTQNIIGLINQVGDDLSNRKLYNYSKLLDVDLVVTTSKANIEKMKQKMEQLEIEYQNQQQLQLQEDYENELSNQREQIDNLIEENNTLQSQNEELQNKLEEYQNYLQEYKNNIDALLENQS